jgi:2-keto-4-pentenoate hydratase/2-oxohepta-3-ene-1,7-dioic acid hydratase in catechol pathway
MRLVTYAASDGSRVGVQLEDGVHDAGFDGSMVALIEAGPARLVEVERYAATAPVVVDARLLAPLQPRSLRDFLTFERHLHNVFARLGRDISSEWYQVPGYYKGMPDTVIGPEVEIPWPAYSDFLDHELELAAIIGRPGHDIPAERALEHVFGWTIWNDLSARDVQARELPLNMGPGKAKDWDGSNVLGPCIVTADEIDGTDLAMEVRINGEAWGGARSSEMHHGFAELIAYASQAQTLHPGEVLGSGTAPGGSGIELDRRLAAGDLIEMEIEGIGVLRNRVGAPPGR